MNLENVRREKKVTQTQLSEILKVDQSTISKWERGCSQPNITTLKKIAEVLDCTVDDLIKD